MNSEEIDALWSIDEPAAGLDALTMAIEQHPESAQEIRTQIARSLGLVGKFDEAWQALKLASKSQSAIVRLRIQLESGRLCNSAGDPESALPYFLSAIALATLSKLDFYAIDAAHMLGIVTSQEKSIGWNLKALQMAQASTEERAKKWEGTLLNNLGWAYHNSGSFERALEVFKEASAWQMQHGTDLRKRIAQWTIARCLRSLKRHREAIEVLLPLTAFPEAGFVSEEMAENLLELGRRNDAIPYFQRAYELFSEDPDFQIQQPTRFQRIADLADESSEVEP